MKVICAWCGKDIETKPPLDSDHISHGICEDCKEDTVQKMKQDLEEQEFLWEGK